MSDFIDDYLSNIPNFKKILIWETEKFIFIHPPNSLPTTYNKNYILNTDEAILEYINTWGGKREEFLILKEIPKWSLNFNDCRKSYNII